MSEPLRELRAVRRRPAEHHGFDELIRQAAGRTEADAPPEQPATGTPATFDELIRRHRSGSEGDDGNG
jgi:hypothetical protein